MSTTSPRKRARLLELYSCELDIIVERFMITPSETHQDTLAHMKAVFRGEMDKMWPHDVNGEPLFDLDTVAHGERVLVASSRLVCVHAEPVLEVKLHVVDDSLPKPLKVRAERDCSHHCRVWLRVQGGTQ